MPRPGGYLLDTNIVVALVRGNDLGRYLDGSYHLTAGAGALQVSAAAVGELLALANKFGWGKARRDTLTARLASLDIVDINIPTLLLAYADIDAATEAAGRPMGQNDVWIAATARVLDATLLTTDRDFDHLHGTWIDREWVDPTSKLRP